MMTPDCAAVLSGSTGLGAVVDQVDDAAELLSHPSSKRLAEARRRLDVVESLLGNLLTASELATTTASSLITMRDELSVHLSAAATLVALDLDGQATTVLQRAVKATQAGLQELGELANNGGG